MLKGEAEVIVELMSYWEEEFTFARCPKSMISNPEIENEDLKLI
jgi:hypothetical protein